MQSGRNAKAADNSGDVWLGSASAPALHEPSTEPRISRIQRNNRKISPCTLNDHHAVNNFARTDIALLRALLTAPIGREEDVA
jgi:hypothetical protein